MKFIIRTFALCLAMMSFFLVSCDNEDNSQPIRLEDENPQVIFDNDVRTISLYAYRTEGRTYVVRGGAGTYTAQSQDERVAMAVCNGTQLLIRPVGAGSTTVTISDAAGQTYLLSVKVGYPYVTYAVIGQHIELQGNGLTDNDKAALEQEILGAAFGPMKIVNYTFVDKNEERTEGDLLMGTYCYTFEMGETTVPDEPLGWDFYNSDGFHRQFFFSRFTRVHFWTGNAADDYFYLSEDNKGVMPDCRALDQSPIFRCLAFDVTDDYKDSYPALTHTYYLQVAVMQHSGLLTEPIIGGR